MSKANVGIFRKWRTPRWCFQDGGHPEILTKPMSSFHSIELRRQLQIRMQNFFLPVPIRVLSKL